MSIVRGLGRRIVKWFIAGLIAVLPLFITLAVIVWVAEYVRMFFGPSTPFGQVLRKFGLHFVSNDIGAFLIGIVLVLGLIFLIGIAVESGARNVLQRIADAVLHRIPVVGSIYGTSKQVVALFEKKDTDALKGMQVVMCYFGDQAGAGFLGLLVSPELFRINDRDYQIVIVPTAPVPIGGALLFVPATVVQKTTISVEGLMSIYVSMGVTTGQFIPCAKSPTTPQPHRGATQPG
jgi:uncharacterized membrane protein